MWKRRSFGFKRKKRDDMLSFGTQPMSGSDDAASQGRQNNDFEAPQATQSGVLFPKAMEAIGIYVEAMPKPLFVCLSRSSPREFGDAAKIIQAARSGIAKLPGPN